ncbi:MULTISPECIES: hypothetical protein [unclassified Nocardia]|uniref:hypothetical protein n=1 Tax=unclassified Nocardia TaxID=2637762 RepID=UPI001CE41102|nr:MULTISPECIES: hypothetical protein [unclassified Nocardia]
MKHRTFRTAVAVVLGAAALCFGAACSTSDNSATTTSSAKPSGAGDVQGGSDKGDKATGVAPTTPAPPNLDTPTVQQLNDRISKAFDSSIDNKEKISWIQAAEQDPYLVQNLVEAAKKNKVKVTVTKVNPPQDGKLKADADVTIDGKPLEGGSFIEFIAEGKEWKVSHVFACNIVKTAKIESAACQE